MKIKLNWLKLLNFKGVRDLKIDFHQVTNISGDNATGKTTILDGFLWLFFGKDSTDRKDFEIKTLDENNQPFRKMDHEVSASITVDGHDVIIRRLYKENWKTKRGSSEAEFAGHTTSFFWNDVPLSLEQFQDKVAELIPESIFKLITNTGYFNSLKWQDRRQVLLDIGGKITDQDVMEALNDKITVANKHQWAALFNNLNAKKTIEEYGREIGANKKRIKEELEKVPVRISESKRSLPEEANYDHIESLISTHKAELDRIEDQLLDKTEALKDRQKEITAKMSRIQELNNRKQTIEFEERNAIKDRRQAREGSIQDARRDIQGKEDNLLRVTSDLVKARSAKDALQADQKVLRTRWREIDAEKLEFKEGEFSCPACKREFEAAKVEEKKAELTKNFNADKAKRLAETSSQGKKIGEDVAIQEARIAELVEKETADKKEIAQLKSKLARLEEEHRQLFTSENLEAERAIANNDEYNDLKKKIARLEEEVNAPVPDDNKSDLLIRKRNLVDKIDSLKEEARGKELRKKTLERIEELSAQEKELAGSLADLEGIEFSILEFTKAKMDLLESRINGRFKLVKFKLFRDQINGGEVPCCDTLIKGVPYSDANTASRINAGLDIINTLCAHYKAFAPVFVDNAESVNTLLPTDSQLIRLVVSKDRKLKIESPKGELFEAEA